MPYPAKMKSNPGSAPIKKVGHTESDKHGTNSMVNSNTPSVRDQGINTSK